MATKKAVWQGFVKSPETGKPVSGAEVRVFDADSGAAVTLYGDRDGAAGPGNPFFTGSDGFAQFYVDPARIRIEAYDGGLAAQFDDVLVGTLDDGAVTADMIADGSITEPKLDDGAVTEPKLADNSVSRRAASSDIVTQVADYTELKALTGLQDGQVVYVQEEGRGGPLAVIGNAADFAAEIAADPLEGVYVVTADDKVLKRRIANLFQFDICWFGASATPAFDNANIIEKAASLLKAGDLIAGIPGRYEMSRTVFIPVGVTLDGQSGNRSFSGSFDDTAQFASQAGGSYTENYLFFMNISVGTPSTWATAFPNNGSGGARRLSIDGTDTGGINGFKFAGSHHFEDIDCLKVGTLIEKPGAVYTDKVVVERIHSRLRANNTDYLVNLPGLGDAYELRGIASGYTGAETGTTKGIFVGTSRSAEIFGLINGQHLFDGCSAVSIHGCHVEGGHIEARDCNVVIRDNVLFTEEDGDGQIILSSAGDAFGNRYTAEIYDNTFDALVNKRGGWQVTQRPDIVVDAAFSVTLKGNKRKIGDSDEISRQSYCAALVGNSTSTLLAEFNDYAHGLFDRNVTIVNNTVKQSCEIADVFDAFGGVTASTRAFADTGFSLATATYYYQVQLLTDPVRLAGRNASLSEASVALTNDGDYGQLSISWSSISRRGGYMLRVYRGTSAGSYDSYVDVPMVSVQQLFDSGDSLNNFVWKSRTAGAVDTLNSGMVGDVVLNNGYASVRSNGALPSAGTWGQGDMVVRQNISPPGTGLHVTTEYRRLTDGSGHVSNTDWLALQMQQP